MLRLAAPQWLLLLPVLAALAWQIPRLRLWEPLRAACAILLVVCLARPEVRRAPAGMDLWVLIDRSDSAKESVEMRRVEMERILEANRTATDKLFFVDFASAPVLRESAATLEASSAESRLRLAVEYALGLRTKGRRSRILVLTDGMSTESLTGLAGQLQEAQVPLDFRLLSGGSGTDYAIESIRAPERVRPGEGFLIEISATGNRAAEVPYQVLCDGKKVGEGIASLKKGKALVRMAARSTDPGAHKYELRLLPADDARPGNNVAWWWVEVTQGPSVLLVTAFADDPLAAVLRAQGIEVEVVSEPKSLHTGSLSGPRAVVINNVPAHRLPADFLAGLDFFVTAQGGGLLMTGGRFSFGSGGYFQSSLDPLLPVSMELRQEHRRLAVAMAIVLDRSGSMAAGAGGGLTKMDLANEGAARALGLLGPSDAVAVIAVDSQPHVVVPLSRIGRDLSRMSDDVRRIQSAGGGIFVYAALEAAWKELEKSPAGQRHIVLFADAADAEEPGEFRDLLARITAAGGTVSVIGLGTPQDPDAGLLQEIGALGGGRVFFSADASQLPGIFTQETVAVARSAFLTEPVALLDAGGWPEIGAAPIALPPTVDAYNLSYLKPQAAALAVTGDAYQAPLVAFWQRGAGRAAAICFPVAGEYSSTIQSWAGASDFERMIVRWLLPSGPSPGTSLQTSVMGEELHIELLHDSTWTRRLAENDARLVVVSGPGGEPSEVPWEKIEIGRYVARIPIPPGGWLRGVVLAGSEKWPFGPVAAGVDPEWNSAPDQIHQLREVSRLSQGREITDLRDAWQRPETQDYSPINNWLLVLLLGLFLAEVMLTRIRGAH